MDTEQAFTDALEHHRAGRAAEAEQGYRSVLAEVPDHADALYYLGRIAAARGETAEGAAMIEKSLALAPGNASRANNLGTLYQGLGDLARAADWFGAATAVDPGQVEAQFNLATVHQLQGDAEGAEAGYRRAIELAPDFTAAYINLGMLLRLLGRLDEAAVIAAKGAELEPDSPKALNNLGVVLHERFELAGAFTCFKRATELDPTYADAFNNLGSVFRDQNQFDAAAACYRKAIDLNPEHGDAHNNLGSMMQRQGDYPAAQASFTRALEINPDFPPALANMGTIHHRQNRQAEAMRLFRRALEIDPNYAEAHFNVSEVLLLTGDDLEQGWLEHRWRWHKREFRQQWRDYGVPLWDGTDPAGKTIAVWGEQGIGEQVMFASMVPDLLAMGANLVVECSARLIPLFERAFKGIECVPRSTEPVDYAGALDFHIPAGDLGAWLRPDFGAFPDRRSFLEADADKRRALREKYLRFAKGPLVGVSWYSNNPEVGWEKSIDLADWRPLLEIPGLTFIDLQYGDTRAKRQTFEAETGIRLHHDDAVDQLADLDAFAAQVAAMDLVVSISNTTVHMAGALGVPCWVLLSEVPLWRWFQDRSDSPWYPSLRLFRQRRQGDWSQIVGEAAAALGEWDADPDKR